MQPLLAGTTSHYFHQVTSISDQWFFSYCADKQTDTRTDKIENNKLLCWRAEYNTNGISLRRLTAGQQNYANTSQWDYRGKVNLKL